MKEVWYDDPVGPGRRSNRRRRRRTRTRNDPSDHSCSGMEPTQSVLLTHGDCVSEVASEFRVIARSGEISAGTRAGDGHSPPHSHATDSLSCWVKASKTPRSVSTLFSSTPKWSSQSTGRLFSAISSLASPNAPVRRSPRALCEPDPSPRFLQRST